MLYILSGIVAFCILFWLIDNWDQSPEARAQRAYEKWAADCRRRGLTAKQMLDESRFRMAFAKLRQRATEAAIKWPENAYNEARRIAVEEAESLAFIDKAVARRFLRVVEDSQWSEIFYPDGLKAIDSWWKAYGPTAPAKSSADIELKIAAYTTIK